MSAPSMTLGHETAMLESGLRALGVLARHAPIAIDEIARLAGTTRREAVSLVELLVQQGYAVRFADTPCYVLTDLARPLIPCPPDSIH